MYRTATTAAAVALASVANAQDADQGKFDIYVKQQCGPSMIMFWEAMEYGEEPLFQGRTVTFMIDGTPVMGEMFFTVNQENGFWSLFSIYEDGTVCLVSFGNQFTPVID